ncbi:MAG: DUF1667 domain-containing protein [Defluviitaleaceae bacterium]|nr:DUF1667 domain-containing protein [Defluviitaleaceae bacterium]
MKVLYCITCPGGCRLTAMKQDGVIAVNGNGCNKGIEFAEAEMTNPTRSLTTTVRTSLPEAHVLPVRTDGEIPKELIFKAMRELNEMTVTGELDCGDTVLNDLAGSGVRVIATSDVLLRSNASFEAKNSGLESLGSGVGTGGFGMVKNTRGQGDIPGEDSSGWESGVDEMSAPEDERDFLSAAEDVTESPKHKGRPHIRGG